MSGQSQDKSRCCKFMYPFKITWAGSPIGEALSALGTASGVSIKKFDTIKLITYILKLERNYASVSLHEKRGGYMDLLVYDG